MKENETNKVQISALSIITHEVIKYQTMPLKSFFLVFLCSSFKFRPFFPKKYGFWGIFANI